MTYKHLSTCELTLIADFWYQGTKAYQAAKLLKRSQETIYRVYRFLDSETIEQYLKIYQRSVVAVVSRFNYLKKRLAISVDRLKLAGRLIRLSVEQNG